MLHVFRRLAYVPAAATIGVYAILVGPTPVSAAGAVREAQSSTALQVCADPNNLPFSNEAEEGFENRIARLIADELERPVRYEWWPQTIGFVRNTLQARQCDLVVGMATGSERLQNTNPYYRSVYTMVYRADAGLSATTLADPGLRKLHFGVIAGTPPATLLARYNLIGQTRPYQRTVDTRHFSPAQQAIEDVASGEIDVALIWGPIAGYFAKQHAVPLQVVPLLEEPKDVRLDFMISMALRYNEPEWKRTLNKILKENKSEIDRILIEYGVPLLDRKGLLLEIAVQ